MRGFFNSTFKTNPYLERALITGITRVAHESIFSDFNNPKVVTTSSDEYASDFGFTQGEVDAALSEYGVADCRDDVSNWYDGFTFGHVSGIYNPWSITNYLDTGRLSPYWANSSGNALVSALVRRSDTDFKSDFEALLSGGTIVEQVNSQIAFPDLDFDPSTVWALLVASGYLQARESELPGDGTCELAVTNRETMLAFDAMVRRWFAPARVPYNRFVRALLAGDIDAMNAYLGQVALETFSFFDVRRGTTESSPDAPERFCHGFVLGLLVDLRDRYHVRSNRESGFGRYDVMLEPIAVESDLAFVIEFKVRGPRREKTLEDTLVRAKRQISDRRYAADLIARGVPADHVRGYGIAFVGKQVLVG